MLCQITVIVMQALLLNSAGKEQLQCGGAQCFAGEKENYVPSDYVNTKGPNRGRNLLLIVHWISVLPDSTFLEVCLS